MAYRWFAPKNEFGPARSRAGPRLELGRLYLKRCAGRNEIRISRRGIGGRDGVLCRRGRRVRLASVDHVGDQHAQANADQHARGRDDD